jgi:hypothetical protein
MFTKMTASSTTPLTTTTTASLYTTSTTASRATPRLRLLFPSDHPRHCRSDYGGRGWGFYSISRPGHIR